MRRNGKKTEKIKETRNLTNYKRRNDEKTSNGTNRKRNVTTKNEEKNQGKSRIENERR